jgi:hypothetical protein
MQFKDELMRNEVTREKQISKDEEILSLLNRRRKTGWIIIRKISVFSEFEFIWSN